MIWATRVLEIDAYLSNNPDLPKNRLIAYGHFIRFSTTENRKTGQSALTDWLIRHWQKGALAIWNIWGLQRRLKKAPQHNVDTLLRKFCNKHNLSFVVLQGYRAQERNDHEGMRWALQSDYESQNLEEVLLLHFDLVKRVSFQDTTRNVVQRALTLLRSDTPMDLDFYIGLFQLTQVLNIDESDGQTVLHGIIEHMDRTKYIPKATLRADLWMIGAYFGEAKHWQDLKLPPRVTHILRHEPPLSTPALQGWTAMLHAATRNALTGEPHFVVRDADGEWHMQAMRPQTLSARTVRVMTRQYWGAKESNPEFADYLAVFKHLCVEYAKQGTCFYPVPAGQIYDLTPYEPDYPPLLSYHTYKNSGQHDADIHFKESAFPGYYSVDKCGFSGWACPKLEKNVEPKMVDRFFEQLNLQLVQTRKTKYQQTQSEQLPQSNSFLFVALQVPSDVVAQLARMDIFEALAALLGDEASLEAAGIDTIVVKAHPKDYSQFTADNLRDLKTRFPERLHITNAPIHDLLCKAKIVMTVNSGTGAEALLYLKPVIALGEADYSSVSMNPTNSPELAHMLLHASKQIGDAEFDQKIKTYLYKFYQNNAISTLDRI